MTPSLKNLGFCTRSNADQACHGLEEELIIAIRKLSASEKPAPPSQTKPSDYFTCLQAKLQAKNSTARSEAIVMLRQHIETLNEAEVCEPLQYWKESSNSMAPFKEVVKKFICIPATSCESERAFSKAGQIISDRRSRLKSGIVDQLVFVNKNYHSFTK